MNTEIAGFAGMMKASGLTGAGKLADTFLRYLTLLAMARMLGAEALGIFILARTTAMSLSTVGSLGMGYGAVQQIAFHSARKDEDSVQQCLRIVLLLPLLCSVAVALALYGCSGTIAQTLFHKPALAIPLRFLAVSVPLMTFAYILLEALRGFHSIAQRVVLEFYLLPLSNLAFLFLFYAFGWRLEAAVMSFTLSYFVTALAAWRHFRPMFRRKSPHALFKKDFFWSFFRFSLPLTFLNLFLEIRLRIDVLLLGMLRTAADTSVYFVGVRLGYFLSIPLQASHMVFAPMISSDYARGDVSRIESNYKNITKMLFIGSMFCGGFVLLFSREFLTLFGEDFIRGLDVVVLVCLGQIVKTAIGNAGPMLVMIGKSTANLAVMIFTLTLLVLLNLLLIPWLGLTGAGIANFTAVTFSSVLEVCLVYHYLHIHPFRRDFLKPVAAAVTSAALVFAVKQALPSGNFWTVASMALFCLLYATSLALLQFTPQERDLLAALKRKALKWTR